MNDNLLDKVSAEKLDALLDVLCEVISDMRGPSQKRKNAIGTRHTPPA